MSTVEPYCLTIKELAERTRISRTALFAYIADGTMPSFKANKSRLVRVEDVRPFLDKISGRAA